MRPSGTSLTSVTLLGVALGAASCKSTVDNTPINDGGPNALCSRTAGTVLDLSHKLQTFRPSAGATLTEDHGKADYAIPIGSSKTTNSFQDDAVLIANGDFPTPDGTYKLNTLILPENNGTSIDVSLHLSLQPSFVAIHPPDKRDLSRLEIGDLTGPVVYIDISQRVSAELAKNGGVPGPVSMTNFNDDSGNSLTVADIDTVAEHITAGSWIILHTGWSRFYDQTGPGLAGPYMNNFNFPGFTKATLDRIIAIEAQKGIRINGLGADNLPLDSGQASGAPSFGAGSFPAHLVGLQRGWKLLENLTNTNQLTSYTQNKCSLYVGALNHVGGAGAFARVFAECFASDTPCKSSAFDLTQPVQTFRPATPIELRADHGKIDMLQPVGDSKPTNTFQDNAALISNGDFPTPDGTFKLNTLVLPENLSTSIDSASHLALNPSKIEVSSPDVRDLSQLTSADLTGPVVLIDISARVSAELAKNSGNPGPVAVTNFSDSSGNTVTAADIDAIADKIVAGVWIITHTSWSRFYMNSGAGLAGPYVNDFNFPGFTKAAIDRIIQIETQKNIRINGLGADNLPLDSGEGAGAPNFGTGSFPAHVRGLQRGWKLLENLGKTSYLVGKKECSLFVGALNHVGGAGGFARVMAKCYD